MSDQPNKTTIELCRHEVTQPFFGSQEQCVECGATRMWNSMMGWGEWIDGRSAHAIRREKELRNAES